MEHDNPANYNTNNIELSVESLFFYHSTMETLKKASKEELLSFTDKFLKHYLYLKQFTKQEFGKELGFK
jgi:hypothetical protein